MATITVAAPQAGDTVTVGSSTLTARTQYAYGTLTFSGAVEDATFEVCGVTFTLKAAPTERFHCPVAASDTAQAAAAMDTIHAHPVTGPLVRCFYAAGVLTIQARASGTAGNAYTLTGSTGITRSAADFTDAVAVADNEFNIQYPWGATAKNGAIAVDIAARLTAAGYLATAAGAVVTVLNVDYSQPLVTSSNSTRLAVSPRSVTTNRVKLTPVAADPNAGGSVLAGAVGDLCVYSGKVYVCTVADTTWVVVGSQS